MKKYHNLENVYWDKEVLCLTVNGHNYRVDNILQQSARLANANQSERKIFKVCPTGYGIYWPLIDEDLSIDGLLGFEHKYKMPEELSRQKELV